MKQVGKDTKSLGAKTDRFISKVKETIQDSPWEGPTKPVYEDAADAPPAPAAEPAKRKKKTIVHTEVAKAVTRIIIEIRA